MIGFPRVETGERLEQRALAFGLLDFGLHAAHDRVGDLVLDGENVVDVAVEVLGPDFRAIDRVDQGDIVPRGSLRLTMPGAARGRAFLTVRRR